jgi:predicted RNase H-like HicB family nuclease
MTMEIPVVPEPLPSGGFQARSADLLGLTAEGDTPEAALRYLGDLIETRKASGVIPTSIEIPASKSGAYLGAWTFRDEPLFDRWSAEIEAYRQQVEDDPDRP